MPIGWLKTRFGSFKARVLAELADELETEMSEDLVEALAAASAMIAFADGVPSPDEREELLSVFEEEDRLTDVDLDDLFDAFDDYAERFEEDRAAAESEVLTVVSVFDDQPELGRLILRGALAVASSDGTLSPAEEKALGRLCDVLGLEVDELKKPVQRRHDEPDDTEHDED
ncbi:TerB family tellurite resistance protein [Benzoatithermus flavus]|uniref:TerB family tellurite resistance protein n=1 Tax=Benzoatithermus flavus TaxID=3108223 RepID=A0ABU8XPZ9_9PROT